MKFIAITLSVFFLCAPAMAQELPRLKVNGNSLQTMDGKNITLRGVSLCSLDWHKPLDLLERVSNRNSEWPVNVVRLPVQKKEWIKTDPIKYFQKRLDPAVKICRDNNIYCIIDWHDIEAWDKPETHKNLKNFWDIAGPRYAAEKHIMYEIFNEPTEPKAKNRENWLAWRDVAQKWVDAIKLKAPHTVLLVGSPHWSQMASFAQADPLRGKNIMYTTHVYPNYKPKQWDSLFGDASKTLPIFITEWGWSENEATWEGIRGNTADYAQPLRTYLDARPQISWTAWSYDPKCGPAMLGQDKPMADFVQDWLVESAKP